MVVAASDGGSSRSPVRALFNILVAATVIAAGSEALCQELSALPGAGHAASLLADERATGVAVFPARFSDARPAEILDPEGFRVHLTDADDPGEERTFKAGALFDPPLGRFRVWLQGEWSMSPFSELMVFGSARPSGMKSLRAMPVLPAGRVTVDDTEVDQPDLQLRLLFVGEDPVAGRVRHEVSRRRSVGELGEGLLMPAGPVIAALWDPSEERYLALSRPFDLPAGRTLPVTLTRPADGRGSLVLYVRQPARTRAAALAEVGFALEHGGESLMPDLRFQTAWGVYVVWYDLPVGAATLRGGGRELFMEPVSLEISSGEIPRVQGELSVRPFQEEPG